MIPQAVRAETLSELLVRKGLATAAEIQALTPGGVDAAALADLLRRKGLITPEELAALQAPPPKGAPEPAVTVSTDEGFRFKAPDGSRFAAGVLAQMDAAFFDDDQADFANGTDFRRLRPNISGTFLRDYSFRVSYEISGGGSVQDAYVAYGGWKHLVLQAGNFVQPYSFESLASDKYNSFMERALPFVFAISRAPGISLTGSGEQWTAAGAVFGEPLSAADAGDEGWGAALRLTVAPVNQDERVVHAGLSLMRRWPTQDNGEAPDATTLRFSARPESDIATVRFASTGAIPGDVEHYTAIDPELALAWGPLSLQGEYMDVRVSRDRGRKLDFDGWYVQGTWTLTGEPRPYRSDRGFFDGIRPKQPLGSGGWGALELAARLSEVDLGDRDVDGGRERNATLGLNVYPNNMLRWSANVVKVLDVSGGSFDGDEPTIYEMRLQLGY